MLDLMLLRTFLVVYRCSSATKAAEQLLLTQPAVSKHLAALEVHVGRPLFVRGRSGMRPTPAGDDLARQIGPLIDSLAAIAGSTAKASRRAGTLHLGGPVDLLAMRVVPALVQLVEEGTRVVVRPGVVSRLTALLAEGALDLVVAASKTVAEGVEHEALFEEDLVLIAGRPLCARLRGLPRSEAVEVLARGPFCSFQHDMPVLRSYFRTVLGRDLVVPATVVFPDLRALASAVTASAGVAVVPRYVAHDGLERGDLGEPVPGGPRMTNTIYLAIKPGDLCWPRVARARALIVAAAKQWVSTPAGA
jgi:DNA-binding transcriptional LysR family regulator